MHILLFGIKDLTFIQGSIISWLANISLSVHTFMTIKLAYTVAFSKHGTGVSMYIINSGPMLFD